MALVVVVSGCGGYDSVDDLVDATGCTEVHPHSDDRPGVNTVSCAIEDGRETIYISTLQDSEQRDEVLDYTRALEGGTAEKYVLYGEAWIVICFHEDSCNALRDKLGGELDHVQ